jgi:hypothetical protein
MRWHDRLLQHSYQEWLSEHYQPLTDLPGAAGPRSGRYLSY